MSPNSKTLSKIKRQINYLRRDVGNMVGFQESFFKKARGSRILIYHGICLRNHTLFNTIFLTLKTFEKHLQFYQRFFNVISLDDYYHQRFDSSRFNVCITFDDGFANNHKYVLPLLHQYEVPASFFITGIRDAGYDILWNDLLAIASKYGPSLFYYGDHGFRKNRYNKYVSLQNKKTLPELLRSKEFDEKADVMSRLSSLVTFREKKLEDYWLQMNEAQIKELSQSAFTTIGSHGYYHNDLTAIAPENAKDEMIRSKLYLENLTGKNVDAIAFPYGAYSEAVAEEAKNAGYSQLLAMDFLHKNDHLDASMRERLTINPFVSVTNQMHAIITGKYE